MIPVANPRAQAQADLPGLVSAVRRVLKSGSYVLGREVEAFEREFSDYQGGGFAAGVGNGTDAIEVSLAALGVRRGDEVITVSMSAGATVAAVLNAGAVPVLVDIEPGFLCIDPDAVRAAITPRTVGVIAVHLFGQVAEVGRLRAMCDRYKLFLVEDVAQATGAALEGTKAGSFGDLAAFSFYPTKNLGAIGDGGLVFSKNQALVSKAQQLRQYGWRQPQRSEAQGRNSRLDEVQAAILRLRLGRLTRRNERRRMVAKRYQRELSVLAALPRERPNSQHVFHLFVVQERNRDALRAHLWRQGVQTGLHYEFPIHVQPAYQEKVVIPFCLEVTERFSKECLTLPLFPEITRLAQRRVIESANSFAY